MNPLIQEAPTVSFKWQCLLCGVCLLDGPIIDVELMGVEVD